VLRKYSRQNKEIARVNSTQCIRIRNLENEVSRLLAENLGLREQVLRLQGEAESSNAQLVVDHVSRIKADLEVKLSELGALVTIMGDAPPRTRKCSPKKKTPEYESDTEELQKYGHCQRCCWWTGWTITNNCGGQVLPKAYFRVSGS